MIDEQTIKEAEQQRKNQIAVYMIQEGIKDGSLQDFINAKVNLQQARAYHYYKEGLIGNE